MSNNDENKDFKPWIHENVTKMLRDNVTKNTKVLEFGSGYSTIFFQNLTDNLISIEHNKDWYDKILPLINNKTKYILKDINYKSEPRVDNRFYNCDTLEELVGESIEDEYFDIILIDGINRVNCAFGSHKKLKRGGILILDDSNRIKNPASDGSYDPILDITKGWIYVKNNSNSRNTDYWIKP